MSFSLGEYQDIFLEEADEQLQELNQNLLVLEKDPDNIEIINDIFRAAHSLKSSAGFVGLNDLSNLAHKMENLLQGIRDGGMKVTPEIVDVIFKCFDEISSIIDTIASGEQPTQDLTWIIDEIQNVSKKALLQKGGENIQRQAKSIQSKEKVSSDININNDEMNEIIKRIQDGSKCYEFSVSIDKSAQMKWVKAQLIIANLGKIGKVIKTDPSPGDLGDDDAECIIKIIFCSESTLDAIKKGCNIDLVNHIVYRFIKIVEEDSVIKLKIDNPIILIGNEESKAEVIKENDKVIESQKTVISRVKAKSEDEIDDSDEFDEPIINYGRRSSDRLDHDKKKAQGLKTVKVSIEKLDQLLNNVGELVIANSGFFKLYEEIRKLTGEKSIVNEFKNRMEGMSRIGKDLQTGIMKTRMVQIGQIFNRFKRLVRDLTREFNKEIELIIKGEDTELDKKVIDAIGEPLLHLIRNAVDHGIETPKVRKEIGKSVIAKITLNAYQGGNHIFVEVSDDGKGLDIDKIKKKAVEKGLTTSEVIANMDNTEVYNYIFSPGFSTADKVTDLSGRGVGMNVVKQVVSELNGSVSIETEPGMGTRFILTFPLTLAIIPAIMVKVQKELYAIPLSDVVETIKIAQSDITTIEGHEVINLRGEILSLLRLNHFIKLKSALKPNAKIPVVVVGFGNRKIGLIVDLLEGKLEIVIKSLEQNYKTVEGLAGASILGDGSICLILDIAAMINKVISDQDRLTQMERQGLIEKRSFEAYQVEELNEFKPVNEKKIEIKNEITIDNDKEFILKSESNKDTAFKKTVSGAIFFDDDEPKPGIADSGIKGVNNQFDVIKPDDKKKSGTFTETINEKLPQIGSSDDVVINISQNNIERTSSSKLSDADVDKKVQETLEGFRHELQDKIHSTLQGDSIGDHIKTKMNITREDLIEFQIVANIGATNAAESLSKILNKRIELAIPLVEIKPIEKIPEYIGNIDSTYIGVMMSIHGEAKGCILFIINDAVGFEMIDLLYGTDNRKKMELNEDGESALSEITNIIGSSVINVIAEKTGFMLKPDVPTIVHDFLQSIIDSILVMQNIQNDYAIIMDTTFYYENDKLIGNLLYFPDSESLRIIVEGLRSNVGSN